MARKNKDIVHHNWLRFLAIIALCCTIAVMLVALIESAVPGDKSTNQSNAVTDVLAEKLDIDTTKPPQYIEFITDKLSSEYFFTNERIKLPIKAYPKGTSNKCIFHFEEPYAKYCHVDENGYFYYSGPKDAAIRVWATSAYNEEAKCNTTINLRGINPTDECVDSVDVKWYERLNNPVIGDSKNAIDPSMLEVGKRYLIKVGLIIKDEYLEEYGLTSNYLHVPMLPFFLYLDGEERPDLYHFDTVNRLIVFTKPASGNLKLVFRKGVNKYFDDLDTTVTPINKTFDINVQERGYNYMPTQLEMEYAPTYMEGDVLVYEVDEKDSFYNFSKWSSDGSNDLGKFIYADEESQKVASIDGRLTLKKKVNNGVCNVYFVSILNENIKIPIKVIFKGKKPTSMDLIGARTVVLHGTTDYYANYGAIKLYDESVYQWEVIDGADKVTLTGNKITANHLGTATIKYWNKAYPEINGTMTIEIKLFTDFATFVRKAIGHFLLFFILGGGLFATSFLIIKPRFVSGLISPIIVFIFALSTEAIQKITPGRFFTWSDVVIDTVGGLCGIIVAVSIILISALIWKVVNKKSYDQISKDFKLLSAKTIFRRASVLEKRMRLAEVATLENATEITQNDVEGCRLDIQSADCDNLSSEIACDNHDEVDNEKG